MTVFLVPVAAERYQLYVELPTEDARGAVVDPAPGGVAWISRRFRAMLAEAEADRLKRERGEAETGSGLWRKIMRKIAEAIAEQRLLWHLRHQTAADVCHPSDMNGDDALKAVRAEFNRDVAKHLRWMLIDGLIAAVTGPVFFFVPGPNVIAWYFTFRTVGHFLSWRGARKGITAITWRPVPSAPLADIRRAIRLPGADRRHRLNDIASALGLAHLAGFVDRVAPRS